MAIASQVNVYLVELQKLEVLFSGISEHSGMCICGGTIKPGKASFSCFILDGCIVDYES